MGDHKSWGDRLFGLCLTFLIAAIAINVGVDLIRSVWPTLLAIAAGGAAITVIVSLVRQRRDRW